MNQPIVIFSHGKDSEPWGGKITALAECARSRGYQVESVDYRGIDDPLARVTKLLEMARELPHAVLVGSSLGGHVATAASVELQARGLFLMAPAFYMPGFEQYTPRPATCPISIVHGWHDEIVPVANSIRYASEHRATLQVIAADHRMLQHIAVIRAYFDLFLTQLQ
jgi:alpha/beta superfamily hydrolase